MLGENQMQLEIGIESSTPKLLYDLFETSHISAGQGKIIAEGVSIRYKNYTFRAAAELPPILNIVAYIGEHVALPIAVTLLSKYLYEKLKGRASKVTINDILVEINEEKIELIINQIVEKGDENVTVKKP